MDKLRESTNYPLQTDKFRDWKTGAIIKFVESPTTLQINKNDLIVVFEGWESVEDFEAKKPSIQIFRQDLRFPIGEVRAAFSEVFDVLDSEILSFLELSPTKYTTENFSIDLNNLSIQSFARHIDADRNQNTNLFINSPEKFEEVKTLHPVLVGLLIQFVWNFGKSNNQFLFDLQPLHPNNPIWQN